MNSIRKWLYKPKKSDESYLAQFYFADEELNLVAAELDSFDGRKDPERCTMLVNQLRICQDRVLTIIQKIMDEVIIEQRANRDFRVKFPDDVLQDSLSGQLWFGAECLAAGSSILNREVESASMRPLARALTKNLDSLRGILREQCLRSCIEYTDRIREALVIFDKLFAEFELSYVSAMVPVKTMKEYDLLQEVTVLFSETVQRALRETLLSQDMIDYCDPALMFTIPRLAIVCGLLVYPDGPLNPDKEPTSMTEMYRPFQTLLHKIRELLYTLSTSELSLLEKSLCSSEEPDGPTSTSVGSQSDTLLQVDQGFHEVVAPIDTIGSTIFVNSPTNGSPVTPVNLEPLDDQFSQLSPTSTIVEDLSHSDTEESCINLNKSESQDSGLQSEIVSTSDTVLSDCPALVSHDGDVASGSTRAVSDKTVDEPETKDIDLSETNNMVAQSGHPSDKTVTDNQLKTIENDAGDEPIKSSCHDNTNDVDIKQLCRDIVDEIIINAVHFTEGACDQKEDGDKDVNEIDDKVGEVNDHSTVANNDQTAVSRQYSWQYNVQFALPQISLGDSETADRQSSGSFSSDSTISENTGQPSESVSEFVIETLANMNLAPQRRENLEPTRQVHAEENCNCSTSEHAPSTSHSSQPLPYNTRASALNKSKRTDNHVKSRLSKTANAHQSTLGRPSSGNCGVRKTKQDKRDSVENITCEVGSTNVKETKTESSSQNSQNDETSSCSSSCSMDCDCETQCCCLDSETSSCTSDNNDDEEIALALHAAEIASMNEARSRFRNSDDLIHRLFVCIAGVADQLQTNYASDLRHILKCVFEMNASLTPDNEDIPPSDEVVDDGESQTEVSVDDGSVSDLSGVNDSQVVTESSSSASQRRISDETHDNSSPHTPPPATSRRIFDEPPEWVPDKEVERCTACKTPFTFVRRRHHCRNCGKIFCGKCSSTTVPLPHYGHQRPVRVCHRCFLYQVSHFTVSRDF